MSDEVDDQDGLVQDDDGANDDGVEEGFDPDLDLDNPDEGDAEDQKDVPFEDETDFVSVKDEDRSPPDPDEDDDNL